MPYTKSPHYKYFILIISFFSLFTYSYAQSYSRVYAPNTRSLNFVDSVALHTYCKLSKLFTSEEKREKCFVNYGNGMSETFGFGKTPDNNTVTENKTTELVNLENRINDYERELIDIKGLLASSKVNATNTRDTKIINNTIVKYINNNQVRAERNILVKDNSVVVGYSNTALAPYAYVYGANNKVYGNASNTLTVGENINNNIANSVQIGLNDNTKITILSTTTDNKNNGWLGLAGRVMPLNNCQNVNAVNCIYDELLRVPGKIVAKSFEVSDAADVAENFVKDEDDLEAGHIVEFGEFSHNWDTGGNANVSGIYDMSGVVKAKSSKKAIGVVATNPGLILGSQTPNSIPIAFSGRVPVKVTSENGIIKKGDKIKVSNIQSGYGAKSLLDGNVVGTAISDALNDKVLMLVKSEYIYTASNTTNSTNVNNNSENKLCIEDTCLDKNLLKKMLSFFNNIN